MKVRVNIAIPNGDHPWLSHRKIGLAFERQGQVQRPDPTVNTAKKVAWEVDGLLDADGFDRFTIEVIFYAVDGGKPTFWVMQSYRLDDKGALVDHPQDAWPRSFGPAAQPLLSPVATVAAGVVTVNATVHATMIDLTDHVLWMEEALYDADVLRASQDPNDRGFMGGPGNWAPWTLHATVGNPRQHEQCEIRILGQLTKTKKMIPLVAVYPAAAMQGSSTIGVFVFHGPKRTVPDFLKDPTLPRPGPGKSPPGVSAIFNYLLGVARYVRAPAPSTGPSYPGDFGNLQVRPYFGPTYEDAAGVDPNCQLIGQVSRVNKPMVLIVSWGMWPKVTRAAAAAAIRLLWGQNRIAKDQDDHVSLSRFGIGGFSLGGQTVMGYIDKDHDEVWLFEPNTKVNTASGWFNAKPEARRLRLVSGVFFNGILNQVRSGAAAGIKKAPDHFTWMPAGMLQTKPGSNQPYGTGYYSRDEKGCHPRWAKAYEWFFRTGTAPNDNAWRAHQWSIFGGEDRDPTDTEYQTFFGKALELSGY
jgi:hypothetical protein